MAAHLNNPKISVVTVVYNAKIDLEKSILSVLSQNYLNIEYIIIDGGSNDGTVDIIKKYASKINYWVSETDNGIYDAMNKALKAATGDWLYFLGADDFFIDPYVISDIKSYFINENTAYYGNVFFKNSKVNYKFLISKWNLCYRNISHQSLFYPKQYYKTNNYDVKYKVFADHVYNIIFYKSYRFEYINRDIAVYNDAGTSSSTYDPNYYSDLPVIVNTYLGFKYALYVKLRIIIFKLRRFRH